MHRALQKLGWSDGTNPMPIFLVKALNEAREIINDEQCVVTFIASRTILFETPNDRERVINLLMLVLEIDGMEEQEDLFMTRVRVAFDSE